MTTGTGVRVEDHCEGHALCLSFAPEVFFMDDDEERAHVLDVELTDDLLPRLLRAAASCPVQAITLKGIPA